MLESGVPLDAVGMLLAHSSQSAKHAITLRYAERSLDSLRELSAVARPNWRDGSRPNQGAAFHLSCL